MMSLKRRVHCAPPVSILGLTLAVFLSSLGAANNQRPSMTGADLKGSIAMDEGPESTFAELAKLTIQDAIMAVQTQVPWQVFGAKSAEEAGYLIHNAANHQWNRRDYRDSD